MGAVALVSIQLSPSRATQPTTATTFSWFEVGGADRCMALLAAMFVAKMATVVSTSIDVVDIDGFQLLLLAVTAARAASMRSAGSSRGSHSSRTRRHQR